MGLLELLLPDYILAYFDLNAVRKQQDVYHLDLEEMNAFPLNSNTVKLLSQSLSPSITVISIYKGHALSLQHPDCLHLSIIKGDCQRACIYSVFRVTKIITKFLNGFSVRAA